MRQLWVVMTALVAASSGCVAESVFTTRQAGIPVLFGPVRALRDRQPNPGRPMGPVEDEIAQFFFFSSHSHGDRRGYVHTRTTVAWLHEGAGQFDAAFGEASLQCPVCTPHVNSIDVGSYFMLAGAIMEKNWAGLNGSLNQY